MSRSIHTTRQHLTRLRRTKFSTEEARNEAITTAQADLWRKRRIKRQVTAERTREVPAGAPIPLAEVPIVVLEEGPYVFHALTPGDIRSVLSALPTAAVEGITEIRLSLGAARMVERRDASAAEPDPFTGRIGFPYFPGVYEGRVLGTYFSRRGLVAVFAYVLDPAGLTIPRAVAELFLRLQALKTLLHEVAHFHDHAARVSRGRWRADRRENKEWYAEQMEHRWMIEAALPYLEKNYASEWSQFRVWVRQRSGLDLSLAFFAGDSRQTERNGETRSVWSTAGIFRKWVGDLDRCTTQSEAAWTLARDLYDGDHFPECLTVLEQMLRADPVPLDHRALRAAVLERLERCDEAAAEARAVLAADPTQFTAWRTLAFVLFADDDWVGLRTLADQWAAVPEITRISRLSMHRFRAIALCALGDFPAMEVEIAAYVAGRRVKDIAAYTDEVRRTVFEHADRPMPAR